MKSTMKHIENKITKKNLVGQMNKYICADKKKHCTYIYMVF